jgi:diaminopimelate epimerase
MKLAFTKMHGAGNDFVVIDGVRQRFVPTPEVIRFLADRHFGIGADQVLLVEKPQHKENDFRYRIFNCDGGEVEQCGNGARCFMVFVREQGLTSKSDIRVETKKAVIVPHIAADGRVTVDMGEPSFAPDSLPFVPDGLESRAEGRSMLYHAALGGEEAWFSAASMGNPHAVIRVGDTDAAPVETLGPKLERAPFFPKRVNVGFLQAVDRTHGRLRVFERGAGETLACGTGTCAAAVEGIRRGFFDSPVTLSLRGGDLTVRWDGRTDPHARVFLTGPAQSVFSAVIDIPEDLSRYA